MSIRDSEKSELEEKTRPNARMLQVSWVFPLSRGNHGSSRSPGSDCSRFSGI